MNADLWTDIFGRLARTALQIAGTIIVTRGLMSDDSWQAVYGALVTLGSTGWTILAAHRAARAD